MVDTERRCATYRTKRNRCRVRDAESSYPSSTTLLVLCVMPTLAEQVERRIKSGIVRMLINVFAVLFAGGMVAGRLLSGVHWLTDIIGGILLSGELWMYVLFY